MTTTNQDRLCADRKEREMNDNHIADEGAKLTVWYGPMPESNGKTNWTAILHRGDVTRGITLDVSEYPDRTRYEADCMRWVIGEIAEEPCTLDYDPDKHSGYVAAGASERADAEKDAALTSEQRKAIAQDVHVTCSQIPGATFYNAAEMAIAAILAANKEKP